MSLLSKVGITFIYDEYSILKSWWKTGLVMFAIQIIIFIILTYIQNSKASSIRFYGFPISFMIIGLIGFYLTYLDFTETSHRLMNSSFKFGFYIFWLTWLINSGSFLRKRNKDLSKFSNKDSITTNPIQNTFNENE